MSLIIRILILLLSFCFTSYYANATSIWPKLDTRSAQLTTNEYKTIKCASTPPSPYTGPLLIESKYDQTDASKSTLVNTSKSSKEIESTIKNYIKNLIRFSKQYKRAKNTQQADKALACLNTWLDSWAKANALTNPEATKTGVASRKWALAAISGVILNTQGYSNNKFQANLSQKRWLQTMSTIVINEYEPRRNPNFTGYFNNHDYWAGWAISVTGMVLNNRNMLVWGHVSLQRALQQAVISSNGKYAWLPYELERGKLAGDYSNYAMIPLMLLADTAKENAIYLSIEEQKKLQLLGNFAILSVLAPQSLPELHVTQSEVKHYKLVWLIPFMKFFPKNDLAKELYLKNYNIDNYSQIGGPIKDFYFNEK